MRVHIDCIHNIDGKFQVVLLGLRVQGFQIGSARQLCTASYHASRIGGEYNYVPRLFEEEPTDSAKP
jgi:hypothetical protein